MRAQAKASQMKENIRQRRSLLLRRREELQNTWHLFYARCYHQLTNLCLEQGDYPTAGALLPSETCRVREISRFCEAEKYLARSREFCTEPQAGLRCPTGTKIGNA